MKLKTILAALCATVLLAGCEETLDDQMTEYMEFYYPSTGAFWYDIAFDWGSYLITTHDKMDEEVHPDSERFRGYVTLRPTVTAPSEGLDPKLFLISPQGEVWSIARSVDIAKSTSREEVDLAMSTDRWRLQTSPCGLIRKSLGSSPSLGAVTVGRRVT